MVLFFYFSTVRNERGRQKCGGRGEKGSSGLIIRQEGHTQVAAVAADLTTQLSVGTRGHQRIFNWVQSSTLLRFMSQEICSCGLVGSDPPKLWSLKVFRIAANKNKSPDQLQMQMQSQPLITLQCCLQLHLRKADPCKNANKLTDPPPPPLNSQSGLISLKSHGRLPWRVTTN